MSLEQFLDESDTPHRTLAFVNRTEPEVFETLLERVFGDQTVALSELEDDQYAENTILLIDDDEVVAHSPLKSLEDAILMVNSDLYITGTRDLDEVEVPKVIDALADHRFRVRGYPESNKEKLLLIIISRHIERLAYETGEGRLRSSFQRLSRIEDERGTRDVYETIADTDVDAHIYGRLDWVPDPELGLKVHGGSTTDYTDTWFVVFNPPEDATATPAALLAIEVDERTWEGFWTYDEGLVADIAAYIRANL